MRFQFLIILSLATFIIFSHNNATADLIAHWSVDDGSGAIARDSVGNNDGALEGDPTWEANGKVNGALSFDGVGDYIQTPLLEELKTGENFSISAWFKTKVTSLGELHIIWVGGAPGNGWGTEPELHMGINHPQHHDKLMFYFGSAQDISGQSINMVSKDDFTDTSNWHHFIGVISNANGPTVEGRFYLDGIQIEHLAEGTDLVTTASTELPPDRNAWDTALRIGGPSADRRYFDGLIDEVGVWDHALTSDEALAVMQYGVNMTTAAVAPVGKLATAWGAIK
jgi:hypothetical protein